MIDPLTPPFLETSRSIPSLFSPKLTVFSHTLKIVPLVTQGISLISTTDTRTGTKTTVLRADGTQEVVVPYINVGSDVSSAVRISPRQKVVSEERTLVRPYIPSFTTRSLLELK